MQVCSACFAKVAEPQEIPVSLILRSGIFGIKKVELRSPPSSLVHRSGNPLTPTMHMATEVKQQLKKSTPRGCVALNSARWVEMEVRARSQTGRRARCDRNHVTGATEKYPAFT